MGDQEKSIGQPIKRDLKLNSLSLNLIHDRTLWRHLIRVANPSSGKKALVVVVLT